MRLASTIAGWKNHFKSKGGNNQDIALRGAQYIDGDKLHQQRDELTMADHI